MYSIKINSKNRSNWFTISVDGRQIYDAGGYAACGNKLEDLPLPNSGENALRCRMAPNEGAGFGRWEIDFQLVGREKYVSPVFKHHGEGYQVGGMEFRIDKSKSDLENFAINHKLLWVYENPHLPITDYTGFNDAEANLH